jgi:hypothetical protein
MGKRLTDEEWSKVEPPFCWLDVRASADSEKAILEKWLINQIGGWWYRINSTDNKFTYVFEDKADMVAVKLWLSSDPFREEHGEIN